MPKAIKDILIIPECECLRIIAGEKGSDRQVNWTAAIEATDIIQFSNEGDLNFVTGLMIRSDEDFLAFVKKAYEHAMAGIVFAPGPYIKEIPQCVIDFANGHAFPILTMPWDVKISTLSHIVGEFVSGEANQKRMPEDILRSILLGREDAETELGVREMLKFFGLNAVSDYRVLLLRIVRKDMITEDELADVYAKLIEGLNQFNFSKAIAVRMQCQIAVVLSNEGTRRVIDEKVMLSLRNMAAKVQVRFDDIIIRIGIGNCYGKIGQIAESYSEALLAASLLPFAAQQRKELYRYDQLGAYKLIWDCRNPEAMLKFSKEVLGALIAYDEINKTDLMTFLGAYFEYDGNALQISEKLYLHKNTVRYKIRKIESILDRSFTCMETILELKLALMILDVYRDSQA